MYIDRGKGIITYQNLNGELFSRVLLSELKPILLAPFFHGLDDVFDLGIISALQAGYDFRQAIVGLDASDHHLEDTDGSAALTLPELRIWVQSLKHIESLYRVKEVAHFVAVIGNQIQQREALI